ncbi:DUF3278 domain-containing protein [Bacillus sp. 123MFChir2]|uniref:DUF3278 domain-containing protein n=1 Tax=Bacillus sp. 123MFChir2 TaxID=1169144 RepID=UPI00036FA908|nr:DUF3278 domain-containing protein [Bacillus sp. 123MFChir2]
MKNEWKEKIYLNFIGAMSERDEYQKQEINKELAVAGVLLWYLNMLVMVIMLVVDTIHNTISIGTIIVFVVNMIYVNYLIWKVQKKRLNETECATEEEYLERKKQLKKSGLKAGLLWGFQMFVLMCYIFPYLGSEEISISRYDVIIWSCGGVFFGLSMYGIGLLNLKKLY